MFISLYSYCSHKLGTKHRVPSPTWYLFILISWCRNRFNRQCIVCLRVKYTCAIVYMLPHALKSSGSHSRCMIILNLVQHFSFMIDNVIHYVTARTKTREKRQHKVENLETKTKNRWNVFRIESYVAPKFRGLWLDALKIFRPLVPSSHPRPLQNPLENLLRLLFFPPRIVVGPRDSESYNKR